MRGNFSLVNQRKHFTQWRSPVNNRHHIYAPRTPLWKAKRFLRTHVTTGEVYALAILCTVGLVLGGIPHV